MSLVHKITLKQIVEVLFQCFLKALEQHWENLFERNFANLEHVFAHWDNWASYFIRYLKHNIF